jgi:hypothetical protein
VSAAPAHDERSKRARDNHDTILNVFSANRKRVIPDPPLAPNLFRKNHGSLGCLCTEHNIGITIRMDHFTISVRKNK